VGSLFSLRIVYQFYYQQHLSLLFVFGRLLLLYTATAHPRVRLPWTARFEQLQPLLGARASALRKPSPSKRQQGAKPFCDALNASAPTCFSLPSADKFQSTTTPGPSSARPQPLRQTRSLGRHRQRNTRSTTLRFRVPSIFPARRYQAVTSSTLSTRPFSPSRPRLSLAANRSSCKPYKHAEQATRHTNRPSWLRNGIFAGRTWPARSPSRALTEPTTARTIGTAP
jgi:hypothetical protein